MGEYSDSPIWHAEEQKVQTLPCYLTPKKPHQLFFVLISCSYK
jgi:hypothetical protein